jgi:hypothetical protein
VEVKSDYKWCNQDSACKDHGWRLQSKVLRNSDAHGSAHRSSKDQNTGGGDASDIHGPIHNSKSIEYQPTLRRCAGATPKSSIVECQDMNPSRLACR